MNKVSQNKVAAIELEIELRKKERSELVEQYEELKTMVKVCGAVSIAFILLYETIVAWMVGQNSHPSIHVIGLCLQPICFIIFSVTGIIALVKGYDWLVGSENELGKKLSAKSIHPSVSEQLIEMQQGIIGLEEARDELLGVSRDDVVSSEMDFLSAAEDNRGRNFEDYHTDTHNEIDEIGEIAKQQIASYAQEQLEDDWSSLFEMDEKEASAIAEPIQERVTLAMNKENDLASAMYVPEDMDTSFLYEDDDEDETMNDLWRKEGIHHD